MSLTQEEEKLVSDMDGASNYYALDYAGLRLIVALVRRLAGRVSELERQACGNYVGHLHGDCKHCALASTGGAKKEDGLCGSCGVPLSDHRPGATCGDPRPRLPRTDAGRVERNKDTPESREFWAANEAAAKALASWPDWRKAGFNEGADAGKAKAACPHAVVVDLFCLGCRTYPWGARQEGGGE